MNCEVAAQSGLIAAYHFNQGNDGEDNSAETTLTDASRNGNKGTLENFTLDVSSVNWVAPGGVVTGTACSSPTPAAALNFDGTDDKIVVTNSGAGLANT